MKLNDHEEIFLSSYSRLRGWAIQIARQDQELAEDLLHDAFIQFTSTQPELGKINNAEAYLYGVIRNLHLSHLRKKTRRDKHTLSIIDFETMRFGLKSARFLDNFQTQEELKRICYFLCLRKESSKSASVMILRFFHGYFPGEIARVMRANSQVVKVRLNTARNEAKSVIENPQAISTIEQRISPELVINKSFRSNVELTRSLAEMIFRSTNGSCLRDERLREIYAADEKETIETQTLAHLVSCRKCIDKVNVLLNLLPLSDRYSVDFIGRDGGGDSGGSEPGSPSGNGSGMNEDLNEKVLVNLRRASKEVFEHEPRELFISIDGEREDSRKIEQNLTNISLELDAAPDFIEIYSEQNVRLAFVSLAADAALPEQLTLALSDDRQLSLKLKRDASKITVDAVYEDPHFENRTILAETCREDRSLAEFLHENQAPDAPLFGGLLDSRQKDRRSLIERLKDAFAPSGFKNAFAGGALAALVIAALVVAKLFVFVPPVSATELIQKVSNLEERSENDAEKVLYRVFNFEERSADGAVLKKRRIELFNDAARKLSVRRLFDENDKLIAGEWRRRDGVSTHYAVGKMSELRLSQADNEIVGKDPENIWQLSVSAKGFGQLVGALDNATVEQENDEYRVNFAPPAENPIASAALVVNRDWRINKMSLAVKQPGAAPREFSFTEAAFEQRPPANVEKTAFEPNPEFLKNVLAAGKTTPEAQKAETAPNEAEVRKSLPIGASPAAATPELEVRVLQLLSGVNALSGDQLNIVKTPAGKLQIKGIVDAKNRKDEILNALSEVRGNPAVSISIQTAEEAAKNKPAKQTDAPLESISVESRNSIPAGELLRDHFSASGVPEDRIEAEIRRFASGALAKSSQVRRSALQMKQIADRFSPAELEKMDETAKANWRRLIKQNAASLAQNSENLRGDLRGPLGIETGGGGNVNPANDAELIRAARRLFELSLAIDRDVRASLSSGGRGSVPAKSAVFANNLGEIIALSRQLR
jgi:RNA polymerase sigma factor (sigma-70 family)